MRKAVWATFSHKCSSDENPQHSLCSESWCYYKEPIVGPEIKYNHKNSLPPAVIRPVYRKLAHLKLLETCLLGKTQNCKNKDIQQGGRRKRDKQIEQQKRDAEDYSYGQF
jgi:hypothetical protein